MINEIVETKTEVITSTKVESVVCNSCGKKVIGEDAPFNSDITHITINFGYGSQFDTDTWDMDICDECLIKFTKTFKHDIDITESF